MSLEIVFILISADVQGTIKWSVFCIFSALNTSGNQNERENPTHILVERITLWKKTYSGEGAVSEGCFLVCCSDELKMDQNRKIHSDRANLFSFEWFITFCKKLPARFRKHEIFEKRQDLWLVSNLVFKWRLKLLVCFSCVACTSMEYPLH